MRSGVGNYILDLAGSLQLEHIFVHCDQAVFYKMSQIMWKEFDKYENVICLMGGFHILLVWLKVLHKQFGCLGLRDWWCESGIVAEGSVDQAAEGRHYSRSMRLHKQSMEALLRFKGSKTVASKSLTEVAQALRSNISPSSLEKVLSHPDFLVWKNAMLQSSGTMGTFVVNYIKEVSAMLSFVVSFRERNMELHLEALQHLVPLLFAFNHQNYARYLTYNHILLSNMKTDNPDAYDDLAKYGPGVSLSGQAFSSIPDDLVTEIGPNRESKTRGGPMRGGYSTSPEAVDTFYKNSHKVAKLRLLTKERLRIKTQNVHSETKSGAKSRHEKQVISLVEKLCTYSNPFEGPAHTLATGVQIAPEIVTGLLTARSTGEEMHRKFYSDRLLSPEIDYFQPIKRSNIKTGLEKKKKTTKALSVLKEDRQALGLIVSKCQNKREAFCHCLTKYPLAIATPDGKLYQPGSKANFRNHLIKQAEANVMSPPRGGTVIYDGMAVIRASKPAATWGHYMADQLKAFTPPSAWHVQQTVIVFDIYIDDQEYSIKDSERQERGSSTRVHMGTNEQRMVNGKDFQNFMHNKENKSELVKRFVDFISQPDTCKNLSVPYLINHRSTTLAISSSGVDTLFECNHEEADTRVVLHAFLSDGPVIIKAKDTDVLILTVYAFALKQPQADWCMQIDHKQFISIGKIVQFLGITTALHLPAFHALTGCDTTSYFFNVSKKSIFERARKRETLPLLEHLGNEKVLSADGEKDIMTFVQTTVYNGKKEDDIVTTRINQYDRLRVKTTQSIIPDPGSLKYLIMRANLATYYLKNFLSPIMEKLDPCQNGWIRDTAGNLQPMWYRGPQMPPVARQRNNARVSRININVPEDSDNDDEIDDVPTDQEEYDEFDWLYSSSEDECDAYDSDDLEYLP